MSHVFLQLLVEAHLYILEEALSRWVKIGLWCCVVSLNKKLLSKLSSITQGCKWEPVEKNARADNEVEQYFIQGAGGRGEGGGGSNVPSYFMQGQGYLTFTLHHESF